MLNLRVRTWHLLSALLSATSSAHAYGPDFLCLSVQIVAFLEKLSELRSLTPMAASMCREMNKLYKLDEAKNCEIRCAWYKVSTTVLFQDASAAILPQLF